MRARYFGYKRKYIGALLCALLWGMHVSAGSFRSLSVKEGLSSRQVYQVNKDSAGYIWAYTHVGIDRYDGSEIKHYKLDGFVDSKDHIQSSTVLTCDRKGTLWVALKDGKLYAYDRPTDSFRLRVDLAEHRTAPVLYDILFDDDNRLWMGLSDGVYRWDETAGALPAALPGQCVYRLTRAGRGVFFAGTGTGVVRLTEAEGPSILAEMPVALPHEMHVTALNLVEGRLFIGTFADGVYLLDKESGEVRPFGRQIPHVPIREFERNPEGGVLIGTDGAGVFCMNVADGRLLGYYSSNEDDERHLGGNTVTDLCVDRQGGIWISTSTNGISYLDPGLPDVSRIAHERNNPHSLISNHVNALFQDSDGDCWYATNNGVSLYSPSADRWTHFLNGADYTGKVILALAEDARGFVWAGGYGTGIYRIDKRTGRVYEVERRRGTSDRGVATDYIFSIYAEDNYVWLGGIEGELTRYDVVADTYTYYPVTCIGDIKPDAHGKLLIAGCDGLAFFDKQSGAIRWRQRFGDIQLRYPIRCLMQSAAGDIWLATDGDGLICFNTSTQKAKVYTTDDGLVSNSINSLLEDGNGHIWFATEKELYYLDPESGVLVSANDIFGISWGFFNANATARLADGRLFFGTAEGVLSFSSTLEVGQDHPVELLFTDFKLLYESVKVGQKGSLLETNINDTEQLTLQYGQNSFSLSFSALNFTSPRRIRYEYRLENQDADWQHSNTVRSVNYMDLSPGRYVFRLRALDRYTGRVVGQRDLPITVRRPYWASWWACLSYAILLAVFIYLLVQYRLHKSNEDKVKEKIRSFISIAHDIRTPITLIKAPLSELETQSSLPEESRKILAVASRNVERLLDMTTQLLELQKVELHAEKLEVSAHDVKAYLEEKLAEFRSAAMQKSVALQLEIDELLPKIWIDRKKMDHILDNLLSNSLKYTEKGTISIRVTQNRKRWSIEVHDTGIGIPKEAQGHIFRGFYRAQNARDSEEIGSGIGLMVTRRLVKQHHGDISFTSEEGKGTTFIVSFPHRLKSATVVKPRKEPEEPVAAAEPQPVVPDEADNGKNVLLLAEDDSDMRDYLTESLSAEYKVISVSDGGKALEMARELNPDIIISDIVMPVLAGDELCRILKSSVDTSHIPVILLTALSERENIIFGLEAGASDYIIKPFDLSVLKVRIRNILQSRQHLRETVLSPDRQPDETDYTSQLDKEFLDKVMEVVNEEIANSEFSINDFCRKLCMSRTSVYNKIKSLTGQGPNDFIRIVRLNRAKELLGLQKYSISEVSTMVGFADPKYFSTCFKKQFGVSPSKVQAGKD